MLQNLILHEIDTPYIEEIDNEYLYKYLKHDFYSLNIEM